MEPLETIEQNNELVQLLEDEQAEVRRILLEMTRRIGERASEIGTALEILAEVELQFAKARFAEEYDCVAPELHDEARAALADPSTTLRAGLRGRPSPHGLILRDARHPLLERNLKSKATASDKSVRPTRVIPATIELEGDRRELIITGKNTGGKTVELKTAGLLALMAQAGIPVPAARMEAPVFDAVLADIGDYQSIEQNLSTFSAHVTNIDFHFADGNGGSLVLLDELGSATDPEEEQRWLWRLPTIFCAWGASRHYFYAPYSAESFASNSAGVVNGAVGFDEATLQPT